ncbi:natural killer cells antigen CD94-like isoform X1 [Tachyglossus aculeatus]|uniref:natural killer cells antigen CD94-like isoform X1 n=1 Tax=Tachyglossus aculeatus TaxID=9261 RepID=UPI0018F2E261|nr:natural killer cells antigen CD94-like isoform X1 [Tachyglossus aculeatus]
MNELNVVFTEKKMSHPTQKQKRGHKYMTREGSLSAPWKLLAGILGVLSLVLMAIMLALGILVVKRDISESSFQLPENSSSLLNTTSQSECYFGSCPEKWIWSRGNCYYISNHSMNWQGSRADCMKRNSSLLKIESREELNDFLKLLRGSYWTGLSYNVTENSWMWDDGVTLSQELLPVVKNFPSGMCVYYGLEDSFVHDDCNYSTFYICKQTAM